jgi:hypothetical protein
MAPSPIEQPVDRATAPTELRDIRFRARRWLLAGDLKESKDVYQCRAHRGDDDPQGERVKEIRLVRRPLFTLGRKLFCELF